LACIFGVNVRMGNVAERSWVRFGARWLARVDGVSKQIRLGMLIMTGLSTGSITLKQYGHGEYAWPLIIGSGLIMVVYTYLYTEFGVWNQVSRDRMDLSRNFAGPRVRIDDEMIARGIIAAQKGEELTEHEREACQRELDLAFEELREGVDLDD